MSKLSKYTPYLNIKHDWHGINCITLIEDIYDKNLGFNFDDVWKRLNIGKQFKNKWGLIYTKDILEKEFSENWKKIPITHLQEYDLLFFIINNRPYHFGMYIDCNRFIHVEIKSYCTISYLDDNFRIALKGIYRHEKLVL